MALPGALVASVTASNGPGSLLAVGHNEARLWLPADMMYALRLAAGAAALVGVASSGVEGEASPLAELFASKYRAAVPPQDSLQPGGRLVTAELWPAQGLGRGAAALSPVLRDALARPDAGARLLVFSVEDLAGVAGSNSSSGDGTAHQQEQQQEGCTHIYLRLCQQQRQGKGSGGSSAPAPVLLPLDDGAAAAVRHSEEAEAYQSPAAATPGKAAAQSPAARGRSGAPVALSPAMRGGGGGTPIALSLAMRGGGAPPVALSPAMRGGGAPPVALSPAMRGSAAPPVGLSPGGRPGSGTPGGGSGRRSAGGSAAATPPGNSSSRSSVNGSSSISGGGGKQPAGVRVTDRAKAEALLSTLLADDPSPRVQGMVEALLLRQLAGRRLLPGNLAVLPVFAQPALFVVEATKAAGGGEAGPAPSAAASGGGEGSAALPPRVTASTRVHLLLGDEAAPEVAQAGQDTQQQQQEQQEDVPALAAAAAAEALGCSLDDAGPMAARRAASAGLASRGITFDDLGGATSQGRALREMVALPLQAPHLFSQYHITPPRGVLLYGPPGTGKTVLACATASLARAHFFVINGPEVVSEYYGESEAGLRAIFAAAAALAPSVVFIDELDAVAPSRDGGPGSGQSGGSGGSSARVVTTLLTEMDALGGAAVVVVAATNRPDSLDAALRRPGRFDREIEVGVPTPAERRDILGKQLRGMAHELSTEQVAELADCAHGFVAADLAALCNEAALTALRRIVGAPAGGDGGAPCRITLADFRAAETRTRPSAMRELAFEIPKVSWDDIGGLEEVKQRIREAVELPFKEPDALRRMGVVPPRGILLHGPPGCSKTLLARAVASQARLNFISVKGPELFSKYVGESEKALASLFAKARTNSPSVIFFDEIDGLAMMRDGTGNGGVGVGERMLSQLLQEMDGMQSRGGVIVIGATNRPDCLDPALLRPGRFDRLLQVPPPDSAGRVAIFGVHTRRMPLAPDVVLEELAQLTDGFTGAAIAACCAEAALAALEEDIQATAVAMAHFMMAAASQRQRLLRATKS